MTSYELLVLGETSSSDHQDSRPQKYQCGNDKNPIMLWVQEPTFAESIRFALDLLNEDLAYCKEADQIFIEPVPEDNATIIEPAFCLLKVDTMQKNEEEAKRNVKVAEDLIRQLEDSIDREFGIETENRSPVEVETIFSMVKSDVLQSLPANTHEETLPYPTEEANKENIPEEMVEVKREMIAEYLENNRNPNVGTSNRHPRKYDHKEGTSAKRRSKKNDGLLYQCFSCPMIFLTEKLLMDHINKHVVNFSYNKLRSGQERLLAVLNLEH